MHYPVEILPQPGFVVPFPFDHLVNTFGDYALCYRIEGALKENQEDGEFNGKKKLKRTCFKHLPHMSLNLLGGCFQPGYISFVQHKPASNNWDGETKVCIDDFIDFVTENEQAVPIFYSACHLCQKGIRTFVSFQDKKAYEIMAELYLEKTMAPYEKGKLIELSTDIRMKHVPTMLNYWHVQMEVYPPNNDKEFKDDSAKWRKRIFEHIRDSILCFEYSETLQMDYQIPVSMYMQSK